MHVWLVSGSAAAFMMTAASPGLAQTPVGEVRPYTSESPHPYPGGPGGSAEVWREVVRSPGAAFIRLRFEELEIGAGDALTVTSPDGSQVWRLTGRGPHGSGDVWSFAIDGDTAIVRIHGGSSRAFGYRLTEIVHGTEAPFARQERRPETVCGQDGREPIACHLDDPGVAKTERPVARLIYHSGGMAFACTGVLVQGAVDSLLLTNNHCLSSQAEVTTLQATFGFQQTACVGGGLAHGESYAGERLVATSPGLDYSLVTLHDNPEATWGEVTPTATDPPVGAAFWLTQHPGGGPKQIGYWEDPAQTNRCRIEATGITIEGYAPGSQMEYACDTTPGSSGSPLISADTQQMIGLHHLGSGDPPPCLNAATMMRPICEDAGSLLACDEPTTDFRRYLAEGAEGFFRTFVGVFNPSASASTFVSVETMAADGTIDRSSFWLGPRRNRVVRLREVAGATTASTIVASSLPVVVDRYMDWGAPTPYGSSMERSVAEPSPRWIFGEGATGPFQLFYLLQNPWPETVDVTIRFLREADVPVERTYSVAGLSRYTVHANVEPGLSSANLSAVITATRPIVAERSMYLDSGRPFRSGTAGAGATALSPTWHFAEGATGFFDAFLLLGNLEPDPIEVAAEYLLPDGRVIEKTYAVSGQTRRTVWINAEDAGLGDTPVAVRLSATAPFIAERAMWWPNAAVWREGHVSLGSTETGTEWAVAYAGENCGNGEDSFVLVSNASAEAGRIRVTAYFVTGESTSRVLDLPGHARLTVSAALDLDIDCGPPYSVLVESLGASPVPIAVELSRYFSSHLPFEAGAAALATKVR